VFNQFGLVHGLVPIVDLDTSSADLVSLLKFISLGNTPIGVFHVSPLKLNASHFL
jgi:hypothetical protein